ncbi:MAG: DUF4956 domain-containing protein [Nitrospina sp.]|nr:DUF4956 domain-containing protein [Nitrospina sp.]MBT3876086.1 DUF4956 domain-containing protein [Nitrospina sp.]MBT4048394.1 DUF4956 domain-containing protein [Nitrospina sp.]MBT4556522.1 DUF4956 domain-containing protein [Nitrospina sp.]MBT5348775.1 DUF4956 domain-containing protein [Nitrospina sp.]
MWLNPLGSTLSNRDEFSQVCPFILLTTILIITVVKSSLALSLGLVGALSIVRFRTPIKEPEELAYLFIAIAMGLGLGADQLVPTLVAGPLILAVMAVFKWTRRESKKKNLYLSLDWKGKPDETQGFLTRFNQVLGNHVLVSDLRRMDVREESLEATYFIDVENPDDLSPLVDDLQKSFSGIGVTFIDQNQMPGI